MKIENCPFCEALYGQIIGLDVLTTEEMDRKWYKCKNRHMRHEFCEHMAVAMRKDIGCFSCENCDSPIDDCNCFDCLMVFCDRCNSFFYISCADLASVISANEEKSKEATK